jgi:hypothetical protein
MIICTNYKSSSWCYNYIIAYDIFPPTYTSNIVVDLFPTTFKTRKYQNALGKVRNRIEHQSERVVACGVRGLMSKD